MTSDRVKRHFLLLIPLLGLFLLLAACATTQDRLLDMDTIQVQLRSIQSRAFDTPDTQKTLRTVIATLQDLSFVVDKADATLGTVSATKLQGYQLRITVTVRKRGETQVFRERSFSFPRIGRISGCI